jgi:hypothetical protein
MWIALKLVSELYYKQFTDVNIYTIDNVRIRYAASLMLPKPCPDVLTGEFVPESWD